MSISLLAVGRLVNVVCVANIYGNCEQLFCPYAHVK